MEDVRVIDRADVAMSMLDPLRVQVLTTLAVPGSASTVANALGESRQKINYHLRALESLGLVRLVEERPRRGLTERVVQACAQSFVISPAALGTIAADPERIDHLSTNYLLAAASRLIQEVAEMASAADAARKSLATLTMDTDIRFASAGDRAAFADELADAVTRLVGRYHDEQADDGRWHRLLIAAHPRPNVTDPSDRSGLADEEFANEETRTSDEP